ncbi:MAG: hypothetical protein ACYC6C_06505, partial [Coriobacteriia bacterium]
WGKLFVFYTASASGYTWLVVVGLLGSVVSFGYYGRVLRTMYFDDSPGAEPVPAAGVPECDAVLSLVEAPLPRFTIAEIVIALCALGILALGIAPALTRSGIEPFMRFFTLG